MGWLVVGMAVFGAPPILHLFVENAVFSGVLAKDRGAPRMAVPTTTHPVPQLMPSEVQFGNPETIRENQVIRADLRFDSRESGHLSDRTLLLPYFELFGVSGAVVP